MFALNMQKILLAFSDFVGLAMLRLNLNMCKNHCNWSCPAPTYQKLQFYPRILKTTKKKKTKPTKTCLQKLFEKLLSQSRKCKSFDSIAKTQVVLRVHAREENVI